LYVRTAGGYREIANYYLTLINKQWTGNLIRHVQQQLFLEGPISRAALLVALAFVLGWRANARTPLAKTLLVLTAAAAASLVLGFFGVVSILALLAVPAMVRQFGEYRNRVALAWLGLWIVAAPVYHPYARLLLPYTVVTCLLAGAWLERITRGLKETGGEAHHEEQPLAGSPGAAPAFALVAALVVTIVAWQMRPAGNPWRSSRDLANVAASIAEHVPRGQDVFVLGEPPLAFYVHVSGRPAFRRVALGDLDTLQAVGYLATGVYTDRASNLARGVLERADRLTRIGSFTFHPNDLRLLDDFRPDRARAYLASPDTTFDITLYRVAPAR
jgi:hypothetical protein